MDMYETIISKRDTRSYLEAPIPPEALRRMLQAGRMAGSSKNAQPCRFIAIDDPNVKEELAKCGDFAAWIPSAPLAIAISVPEGGRGEFDAGRAAQNIMLAAWADGISSCPVSMHHETCARRVLGLPADRRVTVVIALGYKSKEQRSMPQAARLAWDEYVRFNRWSEDAVGDR